MLKFLSGISLLLLLQVSMTVHADPAYYRFNAGITGVYAGQIPCADCEGINYRLVLKGNGMYEEYMVYKGKKAKPFTGRGRYIVVGDSLVKLNKRKAGMAIFRIQPSGLLMLDADGQTITGDMADKYVLMKLTRGPGMAVANPGKMGRGILYRKWKAGIGFYAMGEELNWSLDLNFRKFFRFVTPQGDTIIFPASKGARAMDVNMIRYYSESPKGTLIVQIFQKECENPMSKERSDYQVMVNWKAPGDADGKDYKGCGNYTPDFRLEGNWVLQTINGAKADSANYMKGLPHIEFNLTQSRFSGNAGCNGMMGKFTRGEGSDIWFSQAATTLMLCPNSEKERDFLTALDKIRNYKVTGDQLELSARGTPYLVFTRGKRDMRRKRS